MPQTTSSAYSQTVIYTVKIQSCNMGAWYREEQNKNYECTLDVTRNPISGAQEIVFKVMGAYHPVKYIKPHHCRIIKQRIASNMELLTHYGTKQN